MNEHGPATLHGSRGRLRLLITQQAKRVAGAMLSRPLTAAKCRAGSPRKHAAPASSACFRRGRSGFPSLQPAAKAWHPPPRALPSRESIVGGPRQAAALVQVEAGLTQQLQTARFQFVADENARHKILLNETMYFKDSHLAVVRRDLEDECQREDGMCVYSLAVAAADLSGSS